MKRILLVSYHLPSTRHAGGLRLLDLYSEIKRIIPGIYLVLVTVDQTDNGSADRKALQEIFDEVHFLGENEFVTAKISAIEYGVPDFDLVDLEYHQSGKFISLVRKSWPTALILFGPMESQVRAFLISLSTDFRKMLRSWWFVLVQLWLSIVEIYYVLRADRVVVVSDVDQNVLAHFKPKHLVISLPTCLSQQQFDSLGLAHENAQQGIMVFFAYFGSRTNQEALVWFLREVHPVVRAAVPFYRLRIVGHGMTEKVLKLCAGNDIDCVGSVKTVLDGIKGASVGIAPALGGAGIRGKIHQYAAAGIPCVASSIACESLAYSDGESILVAESEKEFAAACISVLLKPELRDQIGSKAYAVCKSKYTWPSTQQQIAAVYNRN